MPFQKICCHIKKGGETMSDAAAGYGFGGGFALIVVLFIILIVVGAAYVDGFY